MASITITIGSSLNKSLSVNDIAYYAHLNAAAGGFQSNSADQNETGFKRLGVVSVINNSTNTITINPLEINVTENELLPTNKTMLLFSKDNKVNTSGLSGYFASVKMSNNSTTSSELFSLGSEIAQSSK